MENQRSTIEFLRNFQEFAWNARYIVAKNLFLGLKSSHDEKEKKILSVEILSNMIAATEDLEAWYSFLRDRKSKDYDIWPYLMSYESTPKTQVIFFNEIEKLKNFDDFVRRFGLNREMILSSTSIKPKEVRTIIENNILRSFELAAKNRSNRLLIRFHNKVKHHFLVLNSTKNDGVIIRNQDDILAVPFDKKEILRAVATTQLFCHGIQGIISILMLEVSSLLEENPLSNEDKKYFIEKKQSGEDDPVKYLKRLKP